MNARERKADPEMTKNILVDSGFQIPVSEFGGTGKYEQKGDIYQEVKAKIDREPAGKLFRSIDKNAAILGLSDRAMRMLVFITCYLPTARDFIEITPDRYSKAAGIKSRTTFTAAKAELIRYGFIAPSHIQGIYWINPDRIFSGSRPKKYPDNTKIVS